MGGDTKVYVTSAQTDVTKINVTRLGWFNVTALARWASLFSYFFTRNRSCLAINSMAWSCMQKALLSFTATTSLTSVLGATTLTSVFGVGQQLMTFPTFLQLKHSIVCIICRCSDGYNFNLFKKHLDENVNSQGHEQLHSLIDKCFNSLRQLSYRHYMIFMKVFFAVTNLQNRKY